MSTAVESKRPEETGKSEVKEIPNDGALMNIKHPLQNRWTFWYDFQDRKTNTHMWAASLKQVYTVGTVEDFWAVYNNIAPAGKLVAGASYHLFKEGVEPKWEDPANEKGGKWLLAVRKGKDGQGGNPTLDDLWLNALLAMIGENLNDQGEICGAVLAIRRQQDKLALWTRTTNEVVCKRVGTLFKESLQVKDELKYQMHMDSIRTTSSFNNDAKYVV
eukprot:Nk52_evm24s284 gene=Nk52_evmTU24s284